MTFELIMRTIATMLIAYLLGSLSPAIIITKLKTGKDIRKMGSGNAGFTNVLRSVGTGPAVATIICDYLKGIIAVLIGWWIFSNLTVTNDVAPLEYVKYGRYLAGMCVIIGHVFPLYYGFRGGKGVVTANALMLVVDWRVFLMIVASFLIIVLITRIISLGSVACAALYPVYTMIVTYFFEYLPYLGTENELRFRFVLISTACALAVGLMVIIMHRENLKRLFNGEEKCIKPKKTEKRS
ncbi:glycerol-3-phosphate 1-O-acyltransferase PlsY [uncultured Ruminococcus sp.]|uniref:glycerol-3-phosphate 1-O-acyltransferase PlsY n=1 Tax=uncultured Ruminococcus sp. TaxID=165186 RepID=UPI00292E038F|nr:glycerol-3-phosphate 1-O-acyltransferase PlsY [uncultured Ruminococcus sp.]